MRGDHLWVISFAPSLVEAHRRLAKEEKNFEPATETNRAAPNNTKELPRPDCIIRVISCGVSKLFQIYRPRRCITSLCSRPKSRPQTQTRPSAGKCKKKKQKIRWEQKQDEYSRNPLQEKKLNATPSKIRVAVPGKHRRGLDRISRCGLPHAYADLCIYMTLLFGSCRPQSIPTCD